MDEARAVEGSGRAGDEGLQPARGSGRAQGGYCLGVKIAVKGGVAGMAAVLAGASIYCIWKGAPERPAAQADTAGFAPLSFAGRDAASSALAG